MENYLGRGGGGNLDSQEQYHFQQGCVADAFEVCALMQVKV